MGSTRFGIIGCGSAAVPVCEAIANSGITSLACVHDLDQTLARELGERYSVPYTTRPEDVLSAEMDAVYIAVPHSLLAPLAKRALDAGMHVLVEKPMALDLESADELIETAESKGLALGVFYEMRYAPIFAQGRELIRSGALGKITGARVQTLIDKPLAYWQVGYSGRSSNPWRGFKDKAGGGVTLMNTSHLLDALLFMTELRVRRISAEMGTLVSTVEVEDTLAATLRLENDAIASVFSGAHIPGAAQDERIEIYGTRGTLRLPDPYFQAPAQVFLNRAHSAIPAGRWDTLPRPAVNVFECAVRDFAQAVQDGEPAPINGYDARRVLQLVLGMYRAAQEHCVVSLEEERNHEAN